MGAVFSVEQHWSDGKRNHVVGLVAIANGTTYVTGGIPLSLLVDQVLSSQPIVMSDVVGQAGYYQYSAGNLYQYRYVPALPSTTPGVLSIGLLRIFLNGTELSAGAVPADVVNDTITFYGIFRKF